MQCNDVRTRIATGDLDDDARHHTEQCALCAGYAQRDAQVDRSLRDELLLVAPTALTLQLLALANRGVQPTHPAARWIVALTLVLTGAVTLLAGQLIGIALAQLGIADPTAALMAQVSGALNMLALSPEALQAFAMIRDAAIWLMVTAIAWTVANQGGRSLRTATG